MIYGLAGGASAAIVGPWLVLALAACRLIEVVARTGFAPSARVSSVVPLPLLAAAAVSAIPLGLALSHLWQLSVLGLAAVWLLALRRSVVVCLLGAAVLGILAAFAGAPI